VLESTPVVFMSDHSPNIDTTENQINTAGVLPNTDVFAVLLRGTNNRAGNGYCAIDLKKKKKTTFVTINMEDHFHVPPMP
jgi:hypothetical protein